MSTLLPFEKVRQINQKYTDIVFGYIRRCQLLFPVETYYQIPTSIQYSILLFFYSFITSKILKNAEIDTLLAMFEEQNKFEELNNSYSYNLLYASYHHGIGENIFKKICHDETHLIWLIETSKGNVFGGYTAKGWRGIQQGCSQDDDKAFIFSIRSSSNHPPRIFNVIKPSKALYNEKGYYCMFGLVGIYCIDADGKRGQTFHQKETEMYGGGEYEELPEDYYLAGEQLFDIDKLEVFQLSHKH